jgi:hypothetical protein
MKKSLLSVITLLLLSFSISTYAAYPLDEKAGTTVVANTEASSSVKSVISTNSKKRIKKRVSTCSQSSKWW